MGTQKAKGSGSRSPCRRIAVWVWGAPDSNASAKAARACTPTRRAEEASRHSSKAGYFPGSRRDISPGRPLQVSSNQGLFQTTRPLTPAASANAFKPRRAFLEFSAKNSAPAAFAGSSSKTSAANH